MIHADDDDWLTSYELETWWDELDWYDKDDDA